MRLEAKDLSFRYHKGNRQILNHVSVGLDSSDRLGLAAPSGFGKTTFCKILAGYEQPDEGQILLDGKPLSEYKGYCPVQLIWQHPQEAVNPRRKMKTVLEEGGKVSHRFEFTNSGPNPFVIQKVETSCGCTTPTFTREPELPGRKGYVEITYDPLYRPGSFRREVTVTSNDRKNINKLIIRGNVIATPRTPQQEFPVEVGGGLMASRTTVGVGYLARGTSQAGTLEYYNDSKNSVTLGVEYESPAIPGFSVSFSSPVLQPGARGVMTLTFDLRSADLWGRLTGGFYLTVNGRKMPVRFTATGIAVEDFSNLTPGKYRKLHSGRSSDLLHFPDALPASS